MSITTRLLVDDLNMNVLDYQTTYNNKLLPTDRRFLILKNLL